MGLSWIRLGGKAESDNPVGDDRKSSNVITAANDANGAIALAA